MNDDPLAELRADWNRQHADIAAIAHNARRWRRRVSLLIVADILAGSLALGVGILFAVIAWRTRDWLFGLSAVCLFLACPLCTISVIRIRRSSLSWKDKTPEGTLHFALRRTLATDKLLTIQFWNGIILLCFVAAVWLCVWAGLISRHYPLLMLMSGIWISAAVAALLWSKWRTARNVLEREQCQRLLAEFQEVKHLESNLPGT
jgi:hypothetical protein